MNGGAATLGVALSGGGAEGLAQLGVLKVLDQAGIPVRYVTGTSSGAVIGAVYATSRDAADAEQRIVRHLRLTGIGFDGGAVAGFELAASPRARDKLQAARRWWRLARPGEALIGGTRMRASLRELLGAMTFADTRLPFAATALDLVSGRRAIFTRGPLVDAVYASSAIPGLFEPLELDGQLLVDGAWAEPAPVATCRQLGAQVVVAVDVHRMGRRMGGRGAVSTALRADSVARDILEQVQLRDADLVVRVNVDIEHFADFSRPEDLIASGTLAAEPMVAKVRRLLEGHPAGFAVPQPARCATG